MSDHRDLDQTIIFTEEDIRRLRQKNPQPLDQDYFSLQESQAQQVSQSSEVSSLPKEATLSASQSQEFEVNGEVVTSQDRELESEASRVEGTTKWEELEEDADVNPFVYHSKEKLYRETYEKEKQEKEQEAQNRKERLLSHFQDPYEAVYDEESLDMTAYNQFESQASLDEVEELDESSVQVEEGDKTQKVNRLSTWWDKTSHTVKSWFNREDKTDQETTDNPVSEPYHGQYEEYIGDEETDLLEDIVESDLLVDEAGTDSEDQVLDKKDEDSPQEAIDLDVTGPIEAIEVDIAVGQMMGLQTVLDEEELRHEFDLEDEVLPTRMQEREAKKQQKAERRRQILESEESQEGQGTRGQTEEEISFVKGTAWLTAGNIISRILGALYVIPWAAWFGTAYVSANSLYSIGYRSYALFLAISTAGFPSAIAKQLAYYHSKNEYKAADKLFKVSIAIMVGMGVVSSGLFYLLAPTIAAYSATDVPNEAVIVIRSLAPALLILPLMSILRGYFQGFHDMVPTAVSQILEQVARIVYMLAATYAIMQLWTGNVTSAVAHSTFAAFVGALVSLIYLGFIYLRRLGKVQDLIAQSDNQVNLDLKSSLVILIKDSIPFIVLGSGIILAQNIDQFTFKQIIMSTSLMLESEISQIFGVMSLDVDKLIMIIISIAVGMSLSSIPLITSIYAQRQFDKTAHLIEKIMVMFLVVMLPASLGMASISNNAYHLFYANGHEQGTDLLITASYLSVVLGAYTVLSTIIQSMNSRRKAMQFLAIGLGLKLVLQFPFVALWQAHGALLATMVAFLVTSVLTIWEINRLVDLDFNSIKNDIFIILVASVTMSFAATYWNKTLDLLLPSMSRGITFLKIILVVLMAGFIYGAVLGLMGRLHLLIGNRFKSVQESVRLFDEN